jgi:hypothetical protein
MAEARRPSSSTRIPWVGSNGGQLTREEPSTFTEAVLEVLAFWKELND